jgi:hypothetical protein
VDASATATVRHKDATLRSQSGEYVNIVSGVRIQVGPIGIMGNHLGFFFLLVMLLSIVVIKLSIILVFTNISETLSPIVKVRMAM